MPPPPNHAMCKAQNLEDDLHSLEHLKENVAGLDKALQPFITRIKMAQFNMTKSLKNYKITLQRVAMAAKWTSDWKKGIGRQSDCPLKKFSKAGLPDHGPSWLTRPWTKPRSKRSQRHAQKYSRVSGINW
jgi:hypothetical protein